MKQLFVPVICLLVCVSCEKIQSLTDKILKPSARTIYSRDFRDDHSIYKTWNYAYNKALKSKLTVDEIFTFQGQVSSVSNSAYGYRLELEQGEKLIVDISAPNDTTLFFIDFFEDGEDTDGENHSSAAFNKRHFTHTIDKKGTYQIVIQPEINYEDPFGVKLYTQPSYTFPVVEKGNGDIKSFWGAARDGGNRSHEGVDIFADRGTPVVGAVTGYVSRTGNYGLGGKQVWLKDGLFGHSLYYAHLDSIAATKGMRVEVGDTLGFVGNTGNARTTPPHLHFGIYTRRGAVNPYPFIQQRNVPELTETALITTGVTTGTRNNIRRGPSTNREITETISAGEKLQITAKTGRWYQIITENGVEGFIYETLVRAS